VTESVLSTIRRLVLAGKARVSTHGFEEMADDDINLGELVESLQHARTVEEYPDYHKGPCVLVLHLTRTGDPVHALWGTSLANPGEAVLITAYRPDPARWSQNFMKRVRK
jgi:hypothetical protein